MPVIKEQVEQNGCKWAIWRIDETIADLLNLSCARDVRLEAIASIKHEGRKLEYLASRLLLERLTESDAALKTGAGGKPFLLNGAYQISLSHTKGYAAAIVHPTNPVGIDIEAISQQVLKIKDRFLSVAELQGIDEQNSISHLLLHWSAKETVFKALGQEEVDFRTQLEIEKPFPVAQSGSFMVRERRTPEQKAFTVEYENEPQYVLTYTKG